MPELGNIVLRPLNADEVPLLRPCLANLAAHHNQVAKAFKGVYPPMPFELHSGHMKDHITNDTALILGLFRPDGSLDGFGMASYEGSFGEVDYLFVTESLRGQGYGEKMLKLLLDYLSSKQVDLVDLRVVDGNPAREFYEKFGFIPRSLVMSKRLKDMTP